MYSLWILIILVYVGAGSTTLDGPESLDTTERSFTRISHKNQTPLHKAALTQRGYIQFLRWQMPVPEIKEFTFCVWVKSTNLTYPHSIFSYSKNDKDRLVRAWIASHGQSVHLEINNSEIFAQPTSIQEQRWYHICQSWDNRQGHYGLWINGRIELDGYASEMAGHVIPKNGDIVLGQEYTDFDKGLEEGIEGAVLGFNLLLASAFEEPDSSFEQNQLGDESSIEFPDLGRLGVTKSIGPALFPRSPSDLPPSRRYAWNPLIPESLASGSRILRIRKVRQVPITSTWQRNPLRSLAKPMGLRMIETGYYHCEEGRASPFIGGSRLLISWTRTPVKVFGGAILKNVDSQCGVFNALVQKKRY